MDFGTTVLGAVVGGVIGAMSKKKGKILEYALWGGGVGLGVSLVRGGSHEHRVGQLPSQLEPALPGQMTYDLDPRRDPRLDPVSRQNLYPAWLLAHWQNGDHAVIARIQRMLGVPGDGIAGAGTSTAIMSFQGRRGLQTTGMLDIRTIQQLTRENE
jgi:peptidoglycan hydrolase-like protein with peptidoglycan-binding domain